MGSWGINRWVKSMSYRWRTHPALLWLLLVNVALFIAGQLSKLIFGAPGVLSPLYGWVALPAHLPTLLYRPWTLLTYQFYHEGFLHMFFNMLWLWVFAGLFLETQRADRLVRLYLLSGVAGGALYILAYNLFPYFRGVLPIATAVGASASVMGITLATALLNPDRPIYLYGLIRFRLRSLAILVVIIDVVSIAGSNAGGHIAHLGGAAMGVGYYYWLRSRRGVRGGTGGYRRSNGWGTYGGPGSGSGSGSGFGWGSGRSGNSGSGFGWGSGRSGNSGSGFGCGSGRSGNSGSGFGWGSGGSGSGRGSGWGSESRRDARSGKDRGRSRGRDGASESRGRGDKGSSGKGRRWGSSRRKSSSGGQGKQRGGAGSATGAYADSNTGPGAPGGSGSASREEPVSAARMEEILAKLRRGGYASLSAQEKEILFRDQRRG